MNELSVLIPTHNRADVLAQCLEAVRGSSLPTDLRLDIMVVDDASSDDTAAVLEEAVGEDLRVFRHARNRGPAAARNLGIAQARAPYTLIINDDTILAPDAIARFWEYRAGLEASTVTVIGNIAPWPEGTTAFEYWSSHGGSQFTHSRLPPERFRDAGEGEFVTSNMVVETDLLRAHPFDESFRYARYEDRELGMRLARECGHRIHYLPEARSWHCHRLYFHQWLPKWDRFSWAAVHFASLYPEDAALRRTLSLERAEAAEGFSMGTLLEDAARLNAAVPDYFDAQGGAVPQVREVVDPLFRRLQEFARLTFLRQHMGLVQHKAVDDGTGALEAVSRVTEALERHV